LGRALTWTWGIACAVSLLAAIAHLSRAGLVSDFLDNPYSVSMSEADDADANVILATGARIATNGLAFIIMIVFAWRATKNLQMSGATLKRGPGWAIGGWFIPIGNLWIPYQVVRDTWRLAPGADANNNQTVEAIWLAAFIGFWVSVLIGNMAPNGDSFEDLRSADYFGAAASLGLAAVFVGFILTFRSIAEKHDQPTSQR
jgi:hypothetical protein